MPSPVVHVGYALGFGTLIMTATKGSFTASHCLLLAVNSFFGPDIGSFIGWCLSLTFPALADTAMSYIHDSIGYITLIAPLIAFLSSKLLKKCSRWCDENNSSLISLNLKNCYLLSIAGCLLHFQIDHIFEENGKDKFYQWILSTGYFQKPTPPFLPLSVIFVGACTLSLFFGFAWIHLSTRETLSVRLKYTLILFVSVTIIYLTYLAVSQIILKKIAVVGEEADLGVMIFLIIFHILPFILCLLSIQH
ncbi:unnamed protein product [Adineta ricciae]|uniref:Uncharacterized protein n=1 Tax=Adineta ricciae TaxID=249248 RepID=A0A815QFI9_ADIRI|nr:unnamed protein product [Adineta ricciae]CAF1462141.1 unnamed protein product [Adineta ricciae]